MPSTIPVDPRPLPPVLSRDCALFLDVDGCLLDFAVDPDAVGAGPPLVASLQDASTLLGGALALVSGRRVEALDRIFAPVRFPAAGLHGLELRDIEGKVGAVEAPHSAARIAAIAAAASQALARHPGARVEDKRDALALHWRGNAEAETDALAFARTALAELPGYRLQAGDHVVELRPDAADKGTAIARFMQQAPFRGRLPVFAGDDLTDEDGFAWVNAHAGISVLVGHRKGSGARYRLPDVAAVHAWLEAFA